MIRMRIGSTNRRECIVEVVVFIAVYQNGDLRMEIVCQLMNTRNQSIFAKDVEAITNL